MDPTIDVIGIDPDLVAGRGGEPRRGGDEHERARSFRVFVGELHRGGPTERCAYNHCLIAVGGVEHGEHIEGETRQIELVDRGCERGRTTRFPGDRRG